jgi:hypothetical protein
VIKFSLECFIEGFNKSPMFGDFEAQRHWMEITVNLPVSEWLEKALKNSEQILRFQVSKFFFK